MLGVEKSYIAYGQYKRKEVQGMAISRRMFAGSAALIMMLGVMLVMTPQESKASPNPVPALTGSLDPATQEAVVSESQKGPVTFTGSVRVDKLPVERIVVGLTPSVDVGWPSSCSQCRNGSSGVSVRLPSASRAR